MTTAAALFQRSLDASLSQFKLEFEEVFERAAVVGVNRHPLDPLRPRIDGVEPDSNPAFEVPLDVPRGEFGLGAVPLRAVVIMLSLIHIFRMVVTKCASSSPASIFWAST